jgi:plasmid stabilization system protein ParE
VKLVYAPEAVADLTRLRAFIAEKNPAAAARIAAELIARIEHLSAFPHLGGTVNEAPQPDAIRDMMFGNYVVRYSAHADALVILRIWDHREDRPPGDLV